MNTMRIEEFLSKVASEPERTVTQTVWTTPPEVLARMSKPGGLLMTDFLSAPGRRSEQHVCRYGHILGSPASAGAIEAWQSQRPFHPLPADLRALVGRINGIHLWADLKTGRSYAGVAPIEEWEVARIKMYGPTADRSLIDDRYIALSYDQDCESLLVLDVTSGKYFLMDASGGNTTTPIASSADELLDWLWQDRIAPEP